jgi:hypothetical protein
MQTVDWTTAVMEFERFLQLGIPDGDTNHCPTLIIDIVWHSVILNPSLYTRLCERSVGYRIPHNHYDRPREEDTARLHRFAAAYLARYGHAPYSGRQSDLSAVQVDLDHAIEAMAPECPLAPFADPMAME